MFKPDQYFREIMSRRTKYFSEQMALGLVTGLLPQQVRGNGKSDRVSCSLWYTWAAKVQSMQCMHTCEKSKSVVSLE